jgi:hypothetical protein
VKQVGQVLVTASFFLADTAFTAFTAFFSAS